MKFYIKVWILTICIFSLTDLHAEINKSQIPIFIQHSTFDLAYGYIYYPFQAVELEPGYNLHKLSLPQKGIQLSYQYLINRYLSAQLEYLMLLPSVKYTFSTPNNITETITKSVLINTGAFTLNPQLPVCKRWIFNTKAGISLVSRRGIQDDSNNTVLKQASYSSLILGAGLSYKINKTVDFQLNVTGIPKNEEHQQPVTTFFGAGISFHPVAFTATQLGNEKNKNRIHQKHLLQIGFTSNVAGYEINNRMEKMYLFWGGNVQIKQGLTINYLNLIFNSPKLLDFYWGAGVSYYQSNLNNEKIFTISTFPVIRFNLLYIKPMDMYLFYSIAGPSYISSNKIDGIDIGKNIIFQDYMGIGSNIGKKRKFNAELKIAHYSNGNLYPINHGVKIPLTFSLGYAF